MSLPPHRQLLLLLLWCLILGPWLFQLGLSLLGGYFPEGMSLLGKIALSSLLLFALPSLLFPPGKEARQSLFRYRPHPALGGFPLLRLVAIALLSLGLAEGAYLLSQEIAELGGYPTQDLVTEQARALLSASSPSGLFCWLTFALLPAFTEEVFFRGMVQPSLAACLPPSFSRQAPRVLTALLFSLLHFSPLGFVSRFLLGYALSYLADQIQGLRAPILLHLTNNTLALLALTP